MKNKNKINKVLDLFLVAAGSFFLGCLSAAEFFNIKSPDPITWAITIVLVATGILGLYNDDYED